VMQFLHVLYANDSSYDICMFIVHSKKWIDSSESMSTYQVDQCWCWCLLMCISFLRTYWSCHLLRLFVTSVLLINHAQHSCLIRFHLFDFICYNYCLLFVIRFYIYKLCFQLSNVNFVHLICKIFKIKALFRGW